MTTVKSIEAENNSSNTSTSRESATTNSDESGGKSSVEERAFKELIAYCDKNTNNDYLLTKKGYNPYKPTKKFCCMS